MSNKDLKKDIKKAIKKYTGKDTKSIKKDFRKGESEINKKIDEIKTKTGKMWKKISK